MTYGPYDEPVVMIMGPENQEKRRREWTNVFPGVPFPIAKDGVIHLRTEAFWHAALRLAQMINRERDERLAAQASLWKRIDFLSEKLDELDDRVPDFSEIEERAAGEKKPGADKSRLAEFEAETIIGDYRCPECGAGHGATHRQDCSMIGHDFVVGKRGPEPFLPRPATTPEFEAKAKSLKAAIAANRTTSDPDFAEVGEDLSRRHVLLTPDQRDTISAALQRAAVQAAPLGETYELLLKAVASLACGATAPAPAGIDWRNMAASLPRKTAKPAEYTILLFNDERDISFIAEALEAALKTFTKARRVYS